MLELLMYVATGKLEQSKLYSVSGADTTVLRQANYYIINTILILPIDRANKKI
ncbi:hypothetical protein BB560_004134, partial [Smittium megazygosporum]